MRFVSEVKTFESLYIYMPAVQIVYLAVPPERLEWTHRFAVCFYTQYTLFILPHTYIIYTLYIYIHIYIYIYTYIYIYIYIYVTLSAKSSLFPGGNKATFRREGDIYICV